MFLPLDSKETFVRRNDTFRADLSVPGLTINYFLGRKVLVHVQ